ncbi:hypothetical protein AWB74_08684 [Caballeronia arvi]|uniref:Uncharacterized protein n=1 Tax=Caballeronia arvi TaxID=1777135 RepID=A0A158L6P1_9BURK|nr:hypothetical protein AWB74_08684 [Caballeronia arvi]
MSKMDFSGTGTDRHTRISPNVCAAGKQGRNQKSATIERTASSCLIAAMSLS